ncbi:MAG: hypothetical protein ACOC90_04655 [Bacteroidota bacterium]
MRKVYQYVKNLIKIAQNYESIIRSIDTANTRSKSAVSIALKAEEVIRDRTDLNADLSFTKHDHTHIIVIGRYKNRDYVKIFSCLHEDLNEIVPILRERQKYASLKFIDCPLSMRGVLNQDLNLEDL